MYESEGVVAEREVRTDVNGLLQLADRFIVAALEPKRASHSPMRRGIMFVDDHTAPGGLQSVGHVMFAIAPMLKRALPMGERKACMGTGKGRIESYSHLEKPPGRLVLRLGETVHMPKAAVISLPGVQRVGRPQHGSVTLDRFDLARDRRDNPVADVVQDRKDVVLPAIEIFRPNDSRGGGLDQFDAHAESARPPPHGSAGDILDIEPSAGFFGAYPSKAKGKDRSLGDNEEVPQLGEA